MSISKQWDLASFVTKNGFKLSLMFDFMLEHHQLNKALKHSNPIACMNLCIVHCTLIKLSIRCLLVVASGLSVVSALVKAEFYQFSQFYWFEYMLWPNEHVSDAKPYQILHNHFKNIETRNYLLLALWEPITVWYRFTTVYCRYIFVPVRMFTLHLWPFCATNIKWKLDYIQGETDTSASNRNCTVWFVLSIPFAKTKGSRYTFSISNESRIKKFICRDRI